MNNRLNIGIIGAGYWGKNLIRVANALPQIEVRLVSDLNQKTLEGVRQVYPHIKTTQNTEELFRDPSIGAVFIATPVSSHFQLARRALESGKHTWVEKPITKTAEEARLLLALANSMGLVLIVDHTFLYTDAVQKIKKMIDDGELGKLHYVDSERINLGLIQPDVNVLYDLAVHDLSIFHSLLQSMPTQVSAIGAAHITKNRPNPVEEVAHINLLYPGNIVAHIHSSWISPVKIRKMLIGGSKKMVSYNDVEPIEKIKVYNHGVDIDFEKDTTFEPIYRSGDIMIPWLNNNEALADEVLHFIECIREKKEPLTNGRSGVDVMRIIEAAQESIKNNGAVISLV